MYDGCFVYEMLDIFLCQNLRFNAGYRRNSPLIIAPRFTHVRPVIKEKRSYNYLGTSIPGNVTTSIGKQFQPYRSIAMTSNTTSTYSSLFANHALGHSTTSIVIKLCI